MNTQGVMVWWKYLLLDVTCLVSWHVQMNAKGRLSGVVAVGGNRDTSELRHCCSNVRSNVTLCTNGFSHDSTLIQCQTHFSFLTNVNLRHDIQQWEAWNTNDDDHRTDTSVYGPIRWIWHWYSALPLVNRSDLLAAQGDYFSSEICVFNSVAEAA